MTPIPHDLVIAVSIAAAFLSMVAAVGQYIRVKQLKGSLRTTFRDFLDYLHPGVASTRQAEEISTLVRSLEEVLAEVNKRLESDRREGSHQLFLLRSQESARKIEWLALSRIAEMQLILGEHEKAERRTREALEVAFETRDKWIHAQSFVILADVLRSRGRIKEGLEAAERALEIERSAGIEGVPS